MTFKRSIAVFVALIILMAPTLTRHASSVQAAQPESPAAVIFWNNIARREAVQVAKQSTAHAMTSIAYTQAAVYDAVVAIKGEYRPYQVRLERQPNASLDAAVASAAYHVLAYYFDERQGVLYDDYAAALAAIPDGKAKDAGIAVGQAAADGIIAARQGDGLGADIGFSMPAPAPGVWQLPDGQTPMTPWASKLRPFMLKSPQQFRPGPPTALNSRAYAADFNEVKAVGSLNSPYRTAEQTAIARFWATNPVTQYNAAFEHLAVERGLSAVEAARLFAMGNLVGADALIACFDAKYHYLFWRPQFAIQQGAADGNPATDADPTWKSLLGAPPHAEYPSGHGCLTGAEAKVFATFLGTNRIDLELTSTAEGAPSTRHYKRVKDLTREVADARVWAGIHFRDATAEGLVLGHKVALWTLKYHFLPER